MHIFKLFSCVPKTLQERTTQIQAKLPIGQQDFQDVTYW